MAKIPWWKGTHGEWFVVAQVTLIVLVFFGPRNLPAWPHWTAVLATSAIRPNLGGKTSW